MMQRRAFLGTLFRAATVAAFAPAQGYDAQRSTRVSYTYARFAYTGPALVPRRGEHGAYKKLVARLTEDRMHSIRL